MVTFFFFSFLFLLFYDRFTMSLQSTFEPKSLLLVCFIDPQHLVRHWCPPINIQTKPLLGQSTRALEDGILPLLGASAREYIVRQFDGPSFILQSNL
jgi:hypothetical protein